MATEITYKRGKKSGGRIWTDAEEEAFIKIWSTKEALYSISSKDYHSHLKRLEAIDEIRSEFTEEFSDDLTVEDVKSKIRSLRTIFGKEIAKVRVSIANGAEGIAVHRPTWRHFKALDFLTDNITHKGVQVLEVPIKGEDNTEENEAVTAQGDPPVPVKRLKTTTTLAKKHILGGKFAFKDHRKANTEVDDGDTVFGKHIAHTLRAMADKRQKELLKMKIQNMIFEVQFGEKNSPEHKNTVSQFKQNKDSVPTFISPKSLTGNTSSHSNAATAEKKATSAQLVGKKDTMTTPTLHAKSQLNSVVEGMNPQVFQTHVPPALSHFPQRNSNTDDSL